MKTIEDAGERAGLAAFRANPSGFHDEIDERLLAVMSVPSERERLIAAIAALLDVLVTHGCGRRKPSVMRCGAVTMALLSLLKHRSVEAWTLEQLASRARVSHTTMNKLRLGLSSFFQMPTGQSASHRAAIAAGVARAHGQGSYRRKRKVEVAA